MDAPDLNLDENSCKLFTHIRPSKNTERAIVQFLKNGSVMLTINFQIDLGKLGDICKWLSVEVVGDLRRQVAKLWVE